MTNEALRQLLPELYWLEDSVTRQKCIDLWLDMLADSSWPTIGLEHAVFADDPALMKMESLISHTRHVVAGCMGIYDSMGDMFQQIGSCDRETLLAGALIHDAGKLLEYECVDGIVRRSEQAKMFSHPITGAHYAKKHGFNDRVIHMVLSHSPKLSPEGANAYVTPESLILKYVDETCFKYLLIHKDESK